MKSAKHIAIIIIVAVLCSYACRGTELIEVTASVDKQSAYIGDLIEYSITITYDSSLILTPPPAGANLGGFEVKDYEFAPEEKVEEGRLRQVITFELRTFTTGEYVIPPLPIEYMAPDSTQKFITADPIKIFIKSMLAEGVAADSLEPKPLKGQASLAGRSWTLWIIIGLCLLAVVSAGVYYFMRRKKVIEETPYVDPRPSWEIAYTDLAVLKDKDLPGQGEVKLYYFELSEIMKRYLAKKFEFDAVDMTTAEIGENMDDRTFDEDIRQEMMAFLEHADLVKFAKYMPSAERPEHDWDTAYDLVTCSKDLTVETKVVPEPEPVMAALSSSALDEDQSDLRFAPPELREYFSSDNEEEKP